MPTETVTHNQSNAENKKQNDQSEVTVRGRLFDESKPETFNQV